VLTAGTVALSCTVRVSYKSSEKSFVAILAAIGSQTKKREHDALKEVPSVRRPHIRATTVRAYPRSVQQAYGSGGALILPCVGAEKKCRKNR
jgi:hypothetical protein